MPALAGLSGKNPQDIREDWRLSEDLGLTSLDRVELLSRLENDYGIELDEDRFNALSTVAEIQTYIHEEPLSSKPPGASTVSHWPLKFPVPWIRRAVQRLVTIPLWNHYVEFSTEGLEHLDGMKPPLLFVANHASHLDTVAVLAALPFRWRRLIAPAMQKEYFRAFFDPRGFKWTERVVRAVQYLSARGLMNAYPLPHEMSGVRRALTFTGELVQAGYCPLVYPEGERTPDGEMRSFKSGIGLMAVRLRLPVIPIHLGGMFRVYSIHDTWAHRGSVHMKVGPPQHFEEGRDFDDVAKSLEQAVRQLGE
jgi:long-chain acyl-CoA synthetase